MMSGDNFTEEVTMKRVALGDLTNRQGKRDFSSISDDLGPQSEIRRSKIAVTSDENVHVANQSSKTKTGNNDDDDEKGLCVEEDIQASDSSATDTDTDTDTELDISRGNVVSIISSKSNANEKEPNLLNSSNNFIKSDAVTKSADEVGDGSRDSCASTGSMPACFWSEKKDSDGEGRLSNVVHQKIPAINVCTSVEKDLGVGRLASNLCKSVDGSKLPKSQVSKSLDRCNALKGDGSANFGASADLLKACNCSFCMKAAHIWADLHYQDIKGRLAGLKKSQKEASMLANKYTKGKQTEIHSLGNLNKSSNLESDLTTQWKSLFDRMEDIFLHETNQLQAGYVALKELRENCKMDLERTTGVPSNKY